MSADTDAWSFGPSGIDLIAALDVAFHDEERQMSLWAYHVADQLLSGARARKTIFLFRYQQARAIREEWMRRLFVLETRYGVYAF
ncbi:hypothetical protein [Chromobacterium sp. ATCC 53434]|uniref:hypothetical protein n=1 Tax=Chromobacterium sp. (strain ATCC 53434 / SC 14030) TaxID=2059672 RepID=UPI0013050914|nr:hypothetical protein [Chromobacterium sp. ATCC 53434]